MSPCVPPRFSVRRSASKAFSRSALTLLCWTTTPNKAVLNPLCRCFLGRTTLLNTTPFAPQVDEVSDQDAGGYLALWLISHFANAFCNSAMPFFVTCVPPT
jgi:hypothetical protein